MDCTAYADEPLNMYNAIKNNAAENTFNLLIQYPELMFSNLLGDHNSIFNNALLAFFSIAWSNRMDFE